MGHKGIWPVSYILEINTYFQLIKRTGVFLREHSYFKRGESIPDQWYTVYNPALVPDGYLFVARGALPEHMTVAELIDPSGKVVHEWRISYCDLIGPNVPEVPAHDVILLPDTSVVANFESRPGLIRSDACGGLFGLVMTPIFIILWYRMKPEASGPGKRTAARPPKTKD